MSSDHQLQIIKDNIFSLGKNKKNFSNLGNKIKCKLYCKKQFSKNVEYKTEF